jgi:hypothetical protein
VPDLTPDRLVRLRVWAQGGNPAETNDDGGCPWCGNLEPDGNAHDLALELLDEIERLRAIIEDVRAEGEPSCEYGCAWCGADPGHMPNCAWLKIEAEMAFDRTETSC